MPWAYAYPPSSINWKKTRHVFHTAGAPPSIGSSILATIGSITNIRNALVNSVVANRATSHRVCVSVRERGAPVAVVHTRGRSFRMRAGLDTVNGETRISPIRPGPNDSNYTSRPEKPVPLPHQIWALTMARMTDFGSKCQIWNLSGRNHLD